MSSSVISMMSSVLAKAFRSAMVVLPCTVNGSPLTGGSSNSRSTHAVSAIKANQKSSNECVFHVVYILYK